MKKQEKIIQKINNDKAFSKTLMNADYYGIERFIEDGNRYIKAIKEGRMICNIDTVSSSGMSRTIKFLECAKNNSLGQYQYLNFYAFFTALGFEKVKDKNTFRIHGSGMDMIFHTNYTNIHRMHRLGFITRQQCEELAQMTPQVI